MTAKFKQIIEQLNALITFKTDKSMTDEDFFVSDNWEKWAEVREKLKLEDARSMDDETFLLWCDVTDQYPLRELKTRSANSNHLMIEYLRSQVIAEFSKQK